MTDLDDIEFPTELEERVQQHAHLLSEAFDLQPSQVVSRQVHPGCYQLMAPLNPTVYARFDVWEGRPTLAMIQRMRDEPGPIVDGRGIPVAQSELREALLSLEDAKAWVSRAWMHLNPIEAGQALNPTEHTQVPERVRAKAMPPELAESLLIDDPYRNWPVGSLISWQGSHWVKISTGYYLQECGPSVTLRPIGGQWYGADNGVPEPMGAFLHEAMGRLVAKCQPRSFAVEGETFTEVSGDERWVSGNLTIEQTEPGLYIWFIDLPSGARAAGPRFRFQPPEDALSEAAADALRARAEHIINQTVEGFIWTRCPALARDGRITDENPTWHLSTENPGWFIRRLSSSRTGWPSLPFVGYDGRKWLGLFPRRGWYWQIGYSRSRLYSSSHTALVSAGQHLASLGFTP